MTPGFEEVVRTVTVRRPLKNNWNWKRLSSEEPKDGTLSKVMAR